MSRAAALRHRASDSPVGAFLVVLVALSALFATTHYAIYGSELPTLAVITYAWTPMISAGVTVWLLDESIRDWLGQLRNLRAGAHWYLAGVGIMMLGTEFEVIVAVLLGGDVSVPKYPLLGYALSFAVTLFLAGALEELGWRGFLQPRLQKRVGAVPASVGIGVLWALWHVPMILGGGGNFTVFWEYVLNLMAISVVLGWLYNNTEGALPVVMVTHASHNMPAIGDLTGSAPAVFDVLSGDTVLYLGCALLITLYAGSQTLTRDGSLPGIPGRFGELPLHGENRAE
jgi:membrane protease YdiL (CAAX protease family)